MALLEGDPLIGYWELQRRKMAVRSLCLFGHWIC